MNWDDFRLRSDAYAERCDRYLDAKRDADSRKAAEYEKRIAECGASEVMYKNALKNLRKKMPQR